MASKMLAPFGKVKTALGSGCGAMKTKAKSMGLVHLVIALRVLQFLLAASIIGTMGFVVHWHMSGRDPYVPPEVVYMLVIPLLSLFSMVYLEVTPRTAITARLFHPLAGVAVQGITMLFFASGVLTTTLYLNSLEMCNFMQCTATQSTVGLSGVAWLLWAATTAIAGWEMMRKKNNKQQEELKISESA